MRVLFYREREGERFLTRPQLPPEAIAEVVEKNKEVIEENSTSWGEVEFIYDEETGEVSFWSTDESFYSQFLTFLSQASI